MVFCDKGEYDIEMPGFIQRVVILKLGGLNISSGTHALGTKYHTDFIGGANMKKMFQDGTWNGTMVSKLSKLFTQRADE
jgi:hypothetical protein